MMEGRGGGGGGGVGVGVGLNVPLHFSRLRPGHSWEPGRKRAKGLRSGEHYFSKSTPTHCEHGVRDKDNHVNKSILFR